jgi:hypothetical protein
LVDDVMIGTIDSFIYAITDNKESNISADYFKSLLMEIIAGNYTKYFNGDMRIKYCGETIS